MAHQRRVRSELAEAYAYGNSIDDRIERLQTFLETGGTPNIKPEDWEALEQQLPVMKRAAQANADYELILEQRIRSFTC